MYRRIILAALVLLLFLTPYTFMYFDSFIMQKSDITLNDSSITGTQPSSYGDWIISNETIVSDETIIVNGSIVIQSGGKLLLNNSILLMNSTNGSVAIRVESGGNLTVVDSVISSYRNANDYYIYILESGALLIKNSTISYAGISSNYGKAGITSEAYNTTITDSVVEHGYTGIYLKGYMNATVNNVTIHDCYIGMYVYNTTERVYINESTIYNITSSGIIIDNSWNVTLKNTILNGTGIWFKNMDYYKFSSIVISNCLINGLQVLVYYSQNDINLTDVTAGEIILAYSTNINILNSFVGGVVVYNTSNVYINNTTFQNSDYGAYIYDSAVNVTIEYSVIDCKKGVTVEGPSWWALGSNITLRENSITTNYEGIYVNLTSSSTIYIEANNVTTVANTTVSQIFVAGNDIHIINNTLMGHHGETGIFIQNVSNSIVSRNEIENMCCGIIVNYTYGNLTIKENNIEHNTIGFKNLNSFLTTVYKNNFIDNVHQAYDYGNCTWTYNYLGNYWSDYSSDSIIDDEIGITPYTIYPSSEDTRPLLVPFQRLREVVVISSLWEINTSTAIINKRIIALNDITVYRTSFNVTNSVIELSANSDGTRFFDVNSSVVTIYNSTIRAHELDKRFTFRVFNNSEITILESKICYAYNPDWGSLYFKASNATIESTIFYNMSGTLQFININTVVLKNSEFYESKGIYATDVYNITISEITIAGDSAISISQGTYINIIGNTILKATHGIDIFNSYNNIKISGNIIQNCTVYGIYLENSSHVVIEDNVIVRCHAADNSSKGIYFSFASYINIVHNRIENNDWGIFIPPDASDVVVFYNAIINNTHQAYDYGSQSWDNGSIGNYWSDYNGTDSNNDDIGDSPYYIDNDSVDRYPLMYNPFADMVAPTIEDVYAYTNVTNGTTYVYVYATITDESGVNATILGYSFDNVTWSNITMTFVSENRYLAKIPIPSNNGAVVTVYYRIYASDTLGYWRTTQVYTHHINETFTFYVWFLPTNPSDTDVVTVFLVWNGTIDVVAAKLCFSNGSVWHNITMSSNGTHFYMSIPQSPAKTRIDFKVYVLTNSSNGLQWYVSDTYTYYVIPHETEITVEYYPKNPSNIDPVYVVAYISEENVSTVILSYRYVANYSWVNITMSKLHNIYTAEIPPMHTASVLFIIYAQLNNGTWIASDYYEYNISSIVTSGSGIVNATVPWMGVDVMIHTPNPIQINVSINTNFTNIPSFVQSAFRINDFVVMNKTINVIANTSISTNANSWVFITVSYNQSEIDTFGINEEKLRLYYWNETSQEWELCEQSGVNTIENYVWANVSHLTTFMPIADILPPELSNIYRTPASPSPDDTVYVYATISDPSGIENAVLSYYDGEKWTNVTMKLYAAPAGQSPKTLNLYATIPPKEGGTVIKYMIYAYDKVGNTRVSNTITYTVSGGSSGDESSSSSGSESLEEISGNLLSLLMDNPIILMAIVLIIAIAGSAIVVAKRKKQPTKAVKKRPSMSKEVEQLGEKVTKRTPSRRSILEEQNFDKVLESFREEKGVISKDILMKVSSSKRKQFGSWLADKLIEERNHEAAKDILVEIGDYERAISVMLSLAIFYRSQGRTEEARKLYLEIAELLKKVGDLERAKQFIQRAKSLM